MAAAAEGTRDLPPPPPEPAAALWPLRRARAAVRSRTPPWPMATGLTANAANRKGDVVRVRQRAPGAAVHCGMLEASRRGRKEGGVSWRRISSRSFGPLWSANSGRSRRSSSSSTAGNGAVGRGGQGRGTERDGPRPEGRVGGNMAGPGGSRPSGCPEGDTARGPRVDSGRKGSPALSPVSVLSSRRDRRLSHLLLNLRSLSRIRRKTFVRARKSWKRAR